ncbi:MAG: aminotransferase class V-fold PLP-dependent enzyme, partial [Desulfobacterales bacterium]
MNNVIYLDNNATTMVAPEVVEAMLPYFSDFYGNPSSMHSFGGDVARKVKEARENVARLIGANVDEIVFTSCGTESDGTAIRAAIESNPNKRHIVTSRVEHPAIKNLYESLSKQGYHITFVPVDNQGRLDLDYFYDSLNDDTAVASLMWANNETGVIFPIEEISQNIKDRGIVFHTDAVQAAGKIPIDVASTNVDMLSLSGHKFHAPKGIGALYIRKGTKFSPFMIGGHQEHGRRGGTENVASIVGMGKAAALAKEHVDTNGYERIRQMRDKLESNLLKQVPNSVVNGDREHRLPNTTSIA